MKRLVWVSLLLTIAGLLLPLIFMAGNREGNSEEALVSAPPVESPGSVTEPESFQEYIDDEGFILTVLIDGELSSLTMAEYLPRAIAAEMPVSFEAEALKAQAVAARTYVVYCTRHENPKHPDADICSKHSCCLAYLDETALRGNWGENYDANMAIIESARADTDGQILTYEEAVILATFHSSSAGMTEAGAELWGDVPYLKSVASPETSEDVPNFVSTVEVSPENFIESIRLLYPETSFEGDPVLWLDSLELDDSGRVRYMTVCGSTLTGAEVRKLFSLRSTAFTLDYNGEALIFTVTGYGHGLGMSQYGANVMAKNGSTYKDILLHYYPNTELE